jgi:hypothetical protein
MTEPKSSKRSGGKGSATTTTMTTSKVEGRHASARGSEIWQASPDAILPLTYDAMLQEIDASTFKVFMSQVNGLCRQKEVFASIEALMIEEDGSDDEKSGIDKKTEEEKKMARERRTLLLQQLRHALENWEPDVRRLAAPITDTLRQAMSSRYARLTTVQEHFGTLYGSGSGTLLTLPALHMHGGAHEFLPTMSHQAPAYLNPFHPSGVVEIVADSIAGKRGAKKTAAAAAVAKSADNKSKKTRKKSVATAVSSLPTTENESTMETVDDLLTEAMQELELEDAEIEHVFADEGEDAASADDL